VEYIQKVRVLARANHREEKVTTFGRVEEDQIEVIAIQK
jgi:hypothetical protein